MSDNPPILPRSNLPWSFDAFNSIESSVGEPDYSAFILAADGESIIAQMLNDYDANFICVAVNERARLLTALDTIANYENDMLNGHEKFEAVQRIALAARKDAPHA